MSDKIFIDSNIFIYALDKYNPQKNTQAVELLYEAGKTARIYISTQVLNEVYAVATKKLSIDAVLAKEFLRSMYDFEVIIVNRHIIEAAIDCSILNRLSYWDALMIAAAEESKCSQLWTEDMQNGVTIRGVKIINPFLENVS